MPKRKATQATAVAQPAQRGRGGGQRGQGRKSDPPGLGSGTKNLHGDVVPPKRQASLGDLLGPRFAKRPVAASPAPAIEQLIGQRVGSAGISDVVIEWEYTQDGETMFPQKQNVGGRVKVRFCTL